MKNPTLHFGRLWAFTSLAVSVFAASLHASSPTIESIRIESTNLVVVASVPAGHASIVLEWRDRFSSGAWVPLAVQHVDGNAEAITFELPATGDFGFLRVRADATLPLPASFYTGSNSFDAQLTSSGISLFEYAFGPGADASGPQSREVVESDIWRLDGDTLYFFNQNRGLQVIDISDPDAAHVSGTLNLPTAGEQMYLLAPDHVLLLTRGGCGPSYYTGSSESQVLVVSVKNDVPVVVTNLPIAGVLTESRLVGSALYVASQATRPVPGGNGSTWEWATQIASFDLSNPEKPIARSVHWIPGYNNVVHATDTFFFAVAFASWNGGQSIVHAFDITDPDGELREHDSIPVEGIVADKFKLNWSDGILSVISEVSSNPRRTKLETFSLSAPTESGPNSHVKLGEVEVGHGERLFATRFDGTRAYIVTFLQIDPLWVVDLSDPAHPTVSGELEVPGWSTYIHPLGNRLVAVGVETNRTTVSLFDVSDPNHPALLSRVPLGAIYSYSEANSDEKAFNVLAEEGLILLPVQGYDTNGYLSWIQLIDLTTNSLAVRGIILHDFAPRRATLHRDRIVSISATELLSVDATDRDQPQVTGELMLSWPVNRVLLAGDHLIQVNEANNWFMQNQPFLVVTPVSDPSVILNTLGLTNAPVFGATICSNRLYLVQAENGSRLIDGDNVVSNRIWLTVLDLGNLPELKVLGQAVGSLSAPMDFWGSRLEAVWPKPNLIVWTDGGSSTPYWWFVADTFAGPGILPYPFRYGGGGRLFAFDVNDDTAPAFRSEVNLTTNNWWGFSHAFAARGLVYLSRNAFFNLEDPRPDLPWGNYYRSFLDVIDYADPAAPTVRSPVKIPGTLKGISHNGALLYTTGLHRSSTNTYGEQFLDALAYDDVNVHLVASLPLENSYLNPVIVIGTNVFLGASESVNASNTPASTIQTWTLDSSGKFSKLGSVRVSGTPIEFVSFPDLLAAKTTWSFVEVFDRSSPAALRKVGEGPENGCFYFELSKGDALPGRDLWLPLESYGVTRVPLAP